MSIKGFNVNGVTEQYDYNYLDNKPETTGIPVGGTTGQVLTKAGNTDYDVAWEDPDVGADLVMVRGTGADSVISKSDSNPNAAQGQGAFAVGMGNSASGTNAIAVGFNNISSGIASIALGGKVRNKPQNQATQDGAIALGQSNQSSGYYSIAMGREAVASGVGAVAMGYGNTASGNGSFAAGGFTVAGARCSAALGNGTTANGGNSLVAGKYNVIDTAQAAETTGEREFALIIGNGTDANNRSNAMTVDWDGNAVVAGKLTVGAAPVNAMDVATKQYVDQQGGGGGTSDYTALSNKPQINGTTLTGNKTAANLGLASASDLAAKADRVTEVTVSTAGAVTQALDAGKIYHFTGALTALTITLNAPASGDLAQYHFDFLSGSTAPTLTMPNTVTMPDSFTVEANKRYEVDILNNYGTVMSWATS